MLNIKNSLSDSLKQSTSTNAIFTNMDLFRNSIEEKLSKSFFEGSLALKNLDFETALLNFHKVKGFSLINSICKILYTQKKYDLLIKYIEDYLTLNEGNGELFFLLGMSYYNIGNTEYALSNLMSAICNNPNEVKYYEAISKIFLEECYFDDSYEYAEKGFKLKETSALLEIMISSLSKDIQTQNKALEYAEYGIEKFGDSIFYKISIEILVIFGKVTPRLKLLLNNACMLFKDDYFFIKKIYVYLNENNINEAEKMLNYCLYNFEKSFYLYMTAIEFYFIVGDYEKLKKYFSKTQRLSFSDNSYKVIFEEYIQSLQEVGFDFYGILYEISKQANDNYIKKTKEEN